LPDTLGRREFLDVVRTISILQVILFHVLFGVFSYGEGDSALGLISRMPNWMTFAWQPLGVDAIFLVSSFLLTSALLDEHKRFGCINVKAYFLKRLSRILPLYYLALFLFQLGTPFDPLQFVLSAVFLGVTLGVGNVIPVGWSMEAMMIFYLVLPSLVILILNFSRRLLILGVVVLLVTASRITYLHFAEISASRIYLDFYQGLGASDAAQQLYYHPWFRLSPFLIGMGLAFIFHQKSNETSQPSQRRLGLLGLIIMIVCCFSPVQLENSWLYQFPEFILTVYFGASPTIFALALAMIMWNPVVSGAEWVRPVGKICTNVSKCIFGIYLFHMPFLIIAAVIVLRSTDKMQLATISPFQTWATFALTAVISIAFANFLFRFVESPITLWLRRRAA
jgi:peptidoglycan/LPS O-acetylase OafA/YrhL